MRENGRTVEMVGTYSTFPDLDWAVIAQNSLHKALESAGVKELNVQGLKFLLEVTFPALVLGYMFAVGFARWLNLHTP